MNENYEITKYRVAYCPSGVRHYTIQACVVFEEDGKKKTTKAKATKAKKEGAWFGWNKKINTWEFGTEHPRCYFTKRGAEKARQQIIRLGW